MNLKQSLLHQCWLLCLTLALVALCGTHAQAVPVTFSIGIYTSL